MVNYGKVHQTAQIEVIQRLLVTSPALRGSSQHGPSPPRPEGAPPVHRHPLCAVIRLPLAQLDGPNEG